MDGKPMTPTQGQLSRAQILEATATCFLRWGYDATTIRRIASELECAVGTIYRYFRDKRELLYEMTQQVLEPTARAADLGRTVDACKALYRRQAEAAPQMYRLMFWLACVVESPADSGIAPLPAMVTRIIRAWSARIGADRARQQWAQLHAGILAGIDLHTGSEVQAPPPGPRVADLTPLPPQSTPDHAAPSDGSAALPQLGDNPPAAPKRDAAVESTEDVCLL
ncbi:MAG: hypothetical protein CMJ18_01350 [Phycisphaeraceae bacterium]|nr:hypothetical protein [Phycisphaeraceae bacterium]